MGTQWGRTAVLILASFLTMGGVITAAKAELISSALVVYQSTSSELATSGLEGSDVGLGMATMTSRSAAGTDSTKYVLRSGFADGRIDGLCLSQKQTIAGLTYTLKLTGGNGVLGDYEIAGKNAVLDVTNIRGASQSGTTNNGVNLDGRAMLGVASSDITTLTAPDGTAVPNPLDAPTGIGWWGIDADKGNLYNIKGDVYNLVIGGPFSMPGLSIAVLPGDVGCKAMTGYPK